MVKKVTLFYGIKIAVEQEQKKATLMIRGVHNQEDMTAVFMKAKLGLKKEDVLPRVVFDLSDELTREGNEEKLNDHLKENIIPVLYQIRNETIEELIRSRCDKLEVVDYQGDVNLGFSGEKFPDFLLDSTIHRIFREEELFQETKINLLLVSATDGVVQKAVEKHQENYAEHHETNYPKSPVTIRKKGWKNGEPYYSSDEYSSSKAHMLHKSSPDIPPQGGDNKVAEKPPLSQSAPQIYMGNNPHALFTPVDSKVEATVAPSNSEPEETSQVLSKLSIG